MRLHHLLVPVLLILGCRPKPCPPPNGGTDSLPPDSTGADSQVTYLPIPDTGYFVVTGTDTVGSGGEVTDAQLDSILNAPPIRRAARAFTGLRYGYSNWPTSMWGDQPMSCMLQQVTPDNALKLVQAFAKAGMCVFLVPSRSLITTTGRPQSPLSLDRAKETTLGIFKKLPRDTTRKYVGNGTIKGLNLADDYGSRDQWGGTIVTQQQILAWAQYAQGLWQRDMPLGVRVEPYWVKGYSDYAKLAASLDYAWAQYRSGKGPLDAYWKKNVDLAKALDLKLVMGVNIHECTVVGGPPCTAAQLWEFASSAIKHPYNCTYTGWKWDQDDWNNTALRETHFKLAQLATQYPNRSCKRGVSP